MVGSHFGRWKRAAQSTLASFRGALARARNDGELSQQKKPPRGGFFILVSRRSMRVGPDLLLGEVHQTGEDDQEDEDLESEALAGLHVWFGGPHQERGDVLGILRNGRRRAVVIGYLAIAERLRHLDGVAREVLVVVRALRDRDALRHLVLETLEHCRDIVRALLLVLAEEVDEKHRETAAVG